jgi:hypothetical protein
MDPHRYSSGAPHSAGIISAGEQCSTRRSGGAVGSGSDDWRRQEAWGRRCARCALASRRAARRLGHRASELYTTVGESLDLSVAWYATAT